MALWGPAGERRSRQLDISLIQSAVAIQGFKVLEYSVLGRMPEKINAPSGSYRAADGWLALTLRNRYARGSVCELHHLPEEKPR